MTDFERGEQVDLRMKEDCSFVGTNVDVVRIWIQSTLSYVGRDGREKRTNRSEAESLRLKLGKLQC